MTNKLLVTLFTLLCSTLLIQAQDDEGPQEKVNVTIDKRYVTEMNNLAKRPAYRLYYNILEY